MRRAVRTCGHGHILGSKLDPLSNQNLKHGTLSSSDSPSSFLFRVPLALAIAAQALRVQQWVIGLLSFLNAYGTLQVAPRSTYTQPHAFAFVLAFLPPSDSINSSRSLRICFSTADRSFCSKYHSSLGLT